MKKKQPQFNDNETIFEINNENQGKYVPPDPTPNQKRSERRKKEKENQKGADNKKKRHVGSDPGAKDAVGLRVIGGKYRGSKLQYIGDNRVRPMKDRVREAVFNLIGPAIKGMHVVDLFGGTGALTIEAISRGAVSANVIEMHLPTASMLRQNLISLNLTEICELRKIDAFFWAMNPEEHPKGQPPWIIFCSPPYHFYVDRQKEMLDMIEQLFDAAPPGSMMVVESDERFDFSLLPIPADPNRIRSYPPAEIAIVMSPLVD